MILKAPFNQLFISENYFGAKMAEIPGIQPKYAIILNSLARN